MSSKVATLVLSLLAIAEGNSKDTESLIEANSDEVLDVISHELIDRMAHNLYANDEAHLDAYDHLLRSNADKRTKMQYINDSKTPEAAIMDVSDFIGTYPEKNSP